MAARSSVGLCWVACVVLFGTHAIASPINSSSELTTWGVGWRFTYNLLCPTWTEVFRLHASAVQEAHSQPLMHVPTLGGTGDRLRGILQTFLFALLIDRPFQLKLGEQFTEDFVQPTGIYPLDWRATSVPPNALLLEQTYVDEKKKMPKLHYLLKSVLDGQASGNLSRLLDKGVPFITHTNENSHLRSYLKAACSQEPRLSPRVSALLCTLAKATTREREHERENWLFCMFRALFEPSPSIVSVIEQRLAFRPAKVVALHVRYGNLRMTGDPPRVSDEHATKMAACTSTLIQSHSAPVALVAASDNATRMAALMASTAGLEAAVVVGTNASDGVIAHTMKLQEQFNVQPQDIQQGIHRSWLDFFLLSEASSVVFAHSGFPRMACWASLARAAASGNCYEMESYKDAPQICPSVRFVPDEMV